MATNTLDPFAATFGERRGAPRDSDRRLSLLDLLVSEGNGPRDILLTCTFRVRARFVPDGQLLAPSFGAIHRGPPTVEFFAINDDACEPVPEALLCGEDPQLGRFLCARPVSRVLALTASSAVHRRHMPLGADGVAEHAEYLDVQALADLREWLHGLW